MATDMGRTKKNLHLSPEAVADVVEMIPAGLFIYQFEEPDHLILIYGNPESEALTGIKTLEWIGKEFNEIWPEARTRGITREFLEVLETGEPYDAEELYYQDERMTGAFRTRAFALPDRRLAVSFENITEKKRSEARLRASEERFRTLFETMTHGVVYLDASGTLGRANQAAQRILGLTEDQITGRTPMDPQWRAIHEDGSDFPGEEHPVSVALATGREITDVVMGVFNPQDEAYRWLRVSATPVFREGEEEPHEVYAVFDDITAERTAEVARRESEELFRALFDEASDGLLLAESETGTFLLANRAMGRLMRCSREELVGRSVADIHPPKALAEVQASFRKQVSGELRVNSDVPVLRPDGSVFLADVSAAPVEFGGRACAFGAFRDVTKRKRSADILKESEERYRLIFEDSPIPIWEEDHSAVKERVDELRHGGVEDLEEYLNAHPEEVAGLASRVRVVEINQASVQLLGADSKDEVFRDLPRYFSQISFDAFREEVLTLARGGTFFRTEAPIRNVAGEELALDLNLQLFPGAEEDWSRVLVSFLDITPRMQAEAALMESEARFRDLFEQAPLAYQSLDETGRILTVNRAWLDLLGVGRGEAVGKPFANFLAKASVPEYRKRFPRFLETGEVTGSELELVRRDGSSVLVSIDGRLSGGGDYGSLRTHCILRDITEQRKAEEALLAARNRAQLYLDTAEVILVALDDEGRVEMINRKGCELLGRPAGEVVGRTWFQVALPEGVGDEVHDVYKQVLAGEMEPTVYFENPILTSAGEERLVAWYNAFLPGESGRFVGALSSGRDITDLRAAEDRLRESEELFRAIFEQAAAGIVQVSMEGRFLEANARFCEIIGYSEDELRLMTFQEITHPDDLEEDLQGLRRLVEGEIESFSMEKRYFRRDGEIVWAHLAVSVAKDTSGEPTYIIGAVLDITALRAAEKALQTQRERAQLYLDVAEVTLLGLDLEGRVTLVNRAGLKLLGYESEEELLGRDWVDACIPQRERREVRKVFQGVLAGEGDHGEHENPILTRDGDERLVAWRNATIRDSEGTPIGVLGSGLDITDERAALEALVASEVKYRTLFEGAEDGIGLADPETGLIVDCNPAFARMLGRNPQEVRGMHQSQIHPHAPAGGPDGPAFTPTFHRHVTDKGGQVLEDQILGADGEVREVEIKASRIKVGTKDLLLGFFRDVTEQKRAARELRHSEAMLTKAQEIAHLGNWSWRAQDGTVEWSDELFRILGLEPGAAAPSLELYRARVHPDDLDPAQETSGRGLEGIKDGFEVDHRIIQPDGTLRFVRSIGEVAERDVDGNPILLVGTTQDVTEQRRKDEELEETNRRLRELTNKIQTVREEERAGLARELHDELGQVLAGLLIDMDWMDRHLPDGAGDMAERLADMIQLGESASTLVHDISSRLRPPLLDQLGLKAALQWHVEERLARAGIEANFDLADVPLELDDELSITAFRIAQESLTNVIRHAHAKTVTVSLGVSDQDLTLVILDDGVGIADGTLGKASSMGLTGLQERGAALGGSVEIGRRPEGGTFVKAVLPLTRTQTGEGGPA